MQFLGIENAPTTSVKVVPNPAPITFAGVVLDPISCLATQNSLPGIQVKIHGSTQLPLHPIFKKCLENLETDIGANIIKYCTYTYCFAKQ